MAMYDRTYGHKYNKELSRKQIAVCIRNDLKAAMAAGELPKGCKFSVACSPRGSSIDLRVTMLPAGFQIHNPDYGETGPRYGGQSRYTAEAEQMLARLKHIHGAYNHDGSDSMSDYFDVNYYGQASFDWRLESADREAQKERIADQRAVAAQKALEARELAEAQIAGRAEALQVEPLPHPVQTAEPAYEGTRFSLLEVDDAPPVTMPPDEGVTRFSLLEVDLEPEPAPAPAPAFIDWTEVAA
jgi:hypothetical protein